MVGGVGGGSSSVGVGKKRNLFCRYADMKAFEESQREARKTNLGTPLPVPPHVVAISSRTRGGTKAQPHAGAGVRLSDTITMGRKQPRRWRSLWCALNGIHQQNAEGRKAWTRSPGILSGTLEEPAGGSEGHSVCYKGNTALWCSVGGYGRSQTDLELHKHPTQVRDDVCHGINVNSSRAEGHDPEGFHSIKPDYLFLIGLSPVIKIKLCTYFFHFHHLSSLALAYQWSPWQQSSVFSVTLLSVIYFSFLSLFYLCFF